MLTHAEFLRQIDLYLAATGIGPSVLGERAVNDPNLVRQLREGRSPSLSIVGRVHTFMLDNPPKPAEPQEAAQ